MKKIFILVLVCVASISCLGFSALFGEKEPGEDEFKCVSSGKIIPKSFVNDEFCDCMEDGSDEPLTGACSNGRFECDSENPSLIQTLYSSQVTDGICDCCDGSDETNKEIVVCENTCESKMKILFAEKIEQMERYTAGKAVRDEWVQKGKEAKEKRSEKLRELEREKGEEEEKLVQLEKERDREEEEERRESEEKREEENERFKEALKLTTLSAEQLREAVVRVVSKKSQATEALIECYSSFDVEVDDVTALTASVAISEGFAFEELDDLEQELKETERDFERIKRTESNLLRKRNQAEEAVKEAEREVEREREREKEKEEKGEKGEEDDKEEKMKRVWERLGKMKKRSLKKQAEEGNFVHDYDEEDSFNSPNENTGVITQSPTQTLQDTQQQLQQAIEEWESEQEKKEKKEHLVNQLKQEVERLEKEEEGLRDEWEREKYGEFEKAVEGGEGEVVRECLWVSVREGELSRELLEFLSKFGIEQQQNLISPEENLHFSRESAENSRQTTEDCSQHVKDLNKKIDDLNSESDFDFGEEEQYFELFGQCFDTRSDKYKYQFCPFKEARQDSTPLGSFDSESWETDKSFMKFLKGRYCMDKDREATVFFECGKENEIIKVSEPERCEYHLLFRTPAACSSPPN